MANLVHWGMSKAKNKRQADLVIVENLKLVSLFSSPVILGRNMKLAIK